MKAGILGIQLTYSASIPNENEWKGEGQKKQKIMNSHLHFKLISWSGKWGEQAGSRKLHCMEGCIVLTASMVVEMVKLQCSKCSEVKHPYKGILGLLRNGSFPVEANQDFFT